jgi:hypothetical protein
MSGGGAWLVPNLSTPDQVFLEGIFIELHRQRKQLFAFSTKLVHVIDFIRQSHTPSTGRT